MMERREGILHQTTIQAAKGQQKTYNTTTVAGTKRASSEATQQRAAPIQLAQSVELRSATSLHRNVPKLVASTISQTDYGRICRPNISEDPQVQNKSASESSAFDASLLLSHPRYSLPVALVNNLADLGIKEIYPWQKCCLMGPGLLQGARNLVYTAPTGGGKSLVADVLMLKRVLEDPESKALLVLPYVALVQEKVRWLRKIVQGLPRKSHDAGCENKEQILWQRRADEDTIKVIGFFGGGKVRATWGDFDVAVCTFEKVHSRLEEYILQWDR
jgi:ATP-dependent helicase YprA (DUF1998 family)